MTDSPIVITGFGRTPIGSFQGTLSSVSAAQLGAVAIEKALNGSKLPNDAPDEVIMGCVLPAGQGQAPGRQAALLAGVPEDAGATTINKMCGSGLKAIMFGHDLIKAGSSDVMIAGGLESMSRAPYLLDKARDGYRMGHGKVIDHMFYDGLEDQFDHPGRLMGCFAEDTARRYQFTRQAQDNFAIASVEKAKIASDDNSFEAEIAPVTVKTRKGETVVSRDEGPDIARPDKIPNLRPAFDKDGTVTAANSSSISDGAAATILMSQAEAERRGCPIRARIIAHATHSQKPELFTTAPVGAMKKLMEKTGWGVSDIDLFEVNEAFAVVTMAAIKELSLPEEKVNIHGGACVLGHPIGASGARIVVTLISALEKYDLKRGVASLCIGGGEAVAIAVER